MKKFSKGPCQYCGKEISLAGFAQRNHYLMHVRHGEVKDLAAEKEIWGRVMRAIEKRKTDY